MPTCAVSASRMTLYSNTASTLCYPMSVLYRGYVYAAIAGTYTFTMASPDDAVFLWVGDLARTGWNSTNARINLRYQATAGLTTTYTALTAGTYIPIRVVAVNGGAQSGGTSNNPFSWSMTATNPYGIDYDVGTSANPGSANLVRFSCDTTTAPMFPYSVGSEL